MTTDKTVSAIVDAEKEAAKMLFGLAIAICAIPLLLRLPARPFGIVIDISESGFSFLILVSVWFGYWNVMSVLPMEDRAIVALNIGLLFLVSIEPYLFYLNITFDLLSHEALLNAASIGYALDMTGLMVILALFTQQLAMEERGLVPKEALARYKRVRDVLFVSAALFAITVLPTFWTTKFLAQPIRFIFWFIPLITSSARILSERGFQE
ncbi:MAG: hypothetical protein ABSA92_08605 [Candidatus Bathyarchaeia archaeon]|jgi:uncharacterized membrane protein